jgi:LysM repeat protein
MPSPAPKKDPSASYLLQLKLFKALSALLAVVLLGGVGYYFYRQHQLQPVAIMVDGKQVAIAGSSAVATKIMNDYRHSRAGEAFEQTGKPLFVEQVQIVRLPDSQTNEVDTDETVQSKLTSALHVTVLASAIILKKTVLVGLPSQELAEKTLESVKQHYVDLPPNDPLTQEPEFRETPHVLRRRLPANEVRGTVSEAVDFLVTPPPAKTYTVKHGDTGGAIARRFHLSLAEFFASNAGHDMNKLSIGDVVNVTLTTPPLTVIVQKRADREEAIRKYGNADSAGRRRVTVVTTYWNGQVHGAPDTLNMTTIQRAKPSASIM